MNRRDCISISVIFSVSGREGLGEILHNNQQKHVTADFLNFIRALGWPVNIFFLFFFFFFFFFSKSK